MSGGAVTARPPLVHSGDGLSVRVFETIGAVDSEAWDSILDPDDLQVSHRFVRACESAQVENARYRHLLFHDVRGTAAVASLSAFVLDLDLLAPGWARAVTRRLPGVARVPIVVWGLPVSFNQSCLRIRPGVCPLSVQRRVHEEAAALAEETGARLVCAKEFAASERARLDLGFRTLGYRGAHSLPTCTLPLPWSSFATYVGAMRSGYRRQLRATLAARERCGHRIRRASLEAELHRVVPLYQQVMERAEHRMERLERPFFGELAKLPETETLLLEDRSDRLLAAAVLLRGPRRVTFLLTGIDYARARELQGYESLVVSVVEQALSWGAASVELGQTSWALKTRLGAEPRSRHLYFRSLGRIRGLFLRPVLPLAFPRRDVPRRRVFRQGQRPTRTEDFGP